MVLCHGPGGTFGHKEFRLRAVFDGGLELFQGGVLGVVNKKFCSINSSAISKWLYCHSRTLMCACSSFFAAQLRMQFTSAYQNFVA